jgi:hypothetical protein
LRRFAIGNTKICCNESQSAIPDSDFDLVRGPGHRGDAFVDLARGLVCGIGPTMMGGERVTRSEWLHIAAPLVAVIGFLMALISYGFAKQKPWSRRLVIAIFGLIIVYAVVTGALGLIRPAIVWRAIGNGAVFGCVSVWYFYFKPNVVAYFRELAQR